MDKMILGILLGSEKVFGNAKARRNLLKSLTGFMAGEG
jgi:hypothetical protein